MYSWMEKIPDQIGFLVLNSDGGVVNSGGELENEERVAEIIHKMVYGIDMKDLLPSDRKDNFRRMSIHFGNYYYAVTLSNQKIFVSKRKYNPLEPAIA
ncbi:ragulator complex protein LAMTOR4-like [Ornithodoros turicata]|uniref:Late endosomal/lysosomal adaptor and MAPK and MTOR activator 4 n=1 Tax=Ornithodoros turicata TaxID=34597 RepID=A0A2R5LC17_9ACAR